MEFLSTDGDAVFYRGRREDFELSSFRFARTSACPFGLWKDVFAWDNRDVYVLAPASCGGANCSHPDYTGYYWARMGVRSPHAFRWLRYGYGVDDQFAYIRWGEGPLDGAFASSFEVIRCGDDNEGIVLGRDGARLYRDGRLLSDAEAQAILSDRR